MLLEGIQAVGVGFTIGKSGGLRADSVPGNAICMLLHSWLCQLDECMTALTNIAGVAISFPINEIKEL